MIPIICNIKYLLCQSAYQFIVNISVDPYNNSLKWKKILSLFYIKKKQCLENSLPEGEGLIKISAYSFAHCVSSA